MVMSGNLGYSPNHCVAGWTLNNLRPRGSSGYPVAPIRASRQRGLSGDGADSTCAANGVKLPLSCVVGMGTVHYILSADHGVLHGTLASNAGRCTSGGGSHGAFTWGVLDRLLQEVAADRLRISAISGSSAGAINGALTVSGLVQGGAELARRKLADFWHALSRRGFLAGNPFFYGEPGSLGINLDWSPIAIALEAIGLVVSPYTNPFYSDALAPLIAEAFPPADLTAIDAAPEPQLFVAATNVVSNTRTVFTQPDITTDVLRASACLPTEFKAVSIGGVPYSDGGTWGTRRSRPCWTTPRISC